ncbi:MAG: anti-FecI sigma factor, FecR [Crocinitomicaceae bacterium]|jgi:ferric-dicitrate binding protein FerR (iron transport regulator)|nr:anti-FecI sigma factor, FecR [Crocinitomicaceae bacterium]
MDILINKAISGNASPEELVTLKQWIAASEENSKHYEQQVLIWELVGKAKKSPEPDVESAWERFAAKKDAPEIIVMEAARKNMMIYRIAAVFAVILMAGTLFMLFYKPDPSAASQLSKKDGKEQLQQLKNPVLTADNSKHEESPAVNIKRYQKRKDTVYTEQIELVDSSYAKITNNSVLKFLDHTPNQPRIASLSGAGLFDIKPLDKDFILETEELKIKVQGTKFNVQTATEEHKFVEISVEEGFMEVFEKANPSNKVNISSNQKYIYDVEKHLFIEQFTGEEVEKSSKWQKLVDRIFKKNKKY